MRTLGGSLTHHILPLRMRHVIGRHLPQSAINWLSSKANGQLARAEIAMAEQNWPEAIKQWQIVLEASGAHTPVRAFVGMSHALRKQRDLDTAESIVHQAMAFHQDDPHLVEELAKIAMARKIWPEAVKRWQAALDLWGNSAPPSAYIGLAKALYEKSGPDAAEFILRKGILLNPHDPALSRELAHNFKRRPRQRVRDLAGFLFSGFSEPSIAELEQIRRKPRCDRIDRAEASWALSRYFASQGQWAKSLERLLFCSSVAPTNWPLRASAVEVLIAECLLQLGFNDEAEERLRDHAYCLKSSLGPSYVPLANCYLMLSNAMAAKQNWRASKFEEDHPLYWVNQIYKDFGLTAIELMDPCRPLRIDNIAGSRRRERSTAQSAGRC